MSQMTRLPTGAGDITDFANSGASTGWDCVNDDIGSPDDASTYVYTESGSLDVDLFTFTAFNVPTGSTINYLKIYYRGYSSPAGGDAEAYVKVNGSYYEPSSSSTFTAFWADYVDTFTNNPATGLAWTVAQINGTSGLQQFGIVMRGTYAASTQVYALVDYTPPSTPGYSSPGGGGRFATTSNWGWSI